MADSTADAEVFQVSACRPQSRIAQFAALRIKVPFGCFPTLPSLPYEGRTGFLYALNVPQSLKELLVGRPEFAGRRLGLPGGRLNKNVSSSHSPS